MDKKKVLKETLPVLLLCAVGGGLSGFILGSMTHILELIPGLIALVPAIIDMRGNISSAMGSRLGSAFHLGLVERGITSNVALENIKGSISLSVFIGSILPGLFWLTSLFLPFIVTKRVLISLSIISVLTSFTSGLLLSLIAFFIVITAIKFEIDPDNISGPILTTLGDVLTLLVLFFYSYIIGGLIM